MSQSPFDDIAKSILGPDPVGDAMRKMDTSADYLSQHKMLGVEYGIGKILRGQGDILGALSSVTEPLGSSAMPPFDDIAKSILGPDPVGDAVRKMDNSADYLSPYKVLEDGLSETLRNQMDILGALGTVSGLGYPVDKAAQDAITRNLYESLHSASAGFFQYDIAPKFLKDLAVISHGAESMASFQADLFRKEMAKLELGMAGFHESLSELVAKQSAAFKPVADAMADILSVNVSDTAGRLSSLAALPLNSFVYASLAKPVLGAETADLFFGSGRLSAQVGDMLGRTLTALDNPEVEDPYEDLKEWFHEEIGKLKPSAANHRGFRQLFDALIFLLTILQIFLAIEARQAGKVESAWTHKHITGIEATNKKILRELEVLKPQQPAIEYLVMRDARLMSQPRGKRIKIGSLRHGQVVELVKHQREWICVRCLNHSSGLEVAGWVMKKYLRTAPGRHREL